MYSMIQYSFTCYKYKGILHIVSDYIHKIKSIKTCMGMIYRHFKMVIPFGKRGKEKNREINGSGISNGFQLYL